MAEATSNPALSRVVAVINGKGGVGKTSITCNCAGQLGRALKVLVIDLDVSGNAKLDFGLVGHPAEDNGRALVDAIWSGKPLDRIRNVRDNVDVVPGGLALEMLSSLTQMSLATTLPGGSVASAFAAKLAEVADEYDLILLDCPPGNKELQEMALAAARWVLIPTRSEQASWDGLLNVGPRVATARKTNPDLRYLGVVIFDHTSNASRLMRNTQERLAEIGEKVPLFDTFIRHSETTAQDCRSRGQLAHELARDAAGRTSERFQVLRSRRRGRAVGDNVIQLPVPEQLSSMAGSVASDYARLSQEICDRITAAEQADAAARGSAL